ncbi:unnamed protein product, partial [Protopolystoma xenopodis]
MMKVSSLTCNMLKSCLDNFPGQPRSPGWPDRAGHLGQECSGAGTSWPTDCRHRRR